MGILDYDYERDKRYCIFNKNTNLYLKGFKRQKPLWTSRKSDCALYDNAESRSILKRVKNLYEPAHEIQIHRVI